ncbi:hypothetical protein ACOMHN_007903 [Nucella lapillus]
MRDILRLCWKEDSSFIVRSRDLYRGDFNRCLHIACKAGLFLSSDLHPRHGVKAIERAVECHHPNLVRYLYNTGAATNQDLFRLNEVLKAKQTAVYDDREDEEVEADIEIGAFLTQNASQPRSLLTLCLMEVSRHVGWGCVRNANVDQLPISSVFKDSLRLKEEVSDLVLEPQSKTLYD